MSAPSEPPPGRHLPFDVDWDVFIRWAPGDTCCLRIRAASLVEAATKGFLEGLRLAPGEPVLVYAVELVRMERTTGLEPAPSGLGSRRSTDRAASAKCGLSFPLPYGGRANCNFLPGHPGPCGHAFRPGK